MPQIDTFLAWIHWDPHRFILTVPFIERPIAWYGICFALGFIIGLFLLIPIFTKTLKQTKQILERDISDWPTFITELKKGNGDHPNSLIRANLSAEGREQLNNLKFRQEPTAQLKHEILHAINTCLKNTKTAMNRESLEKLFPKALISTKSHATYLTDRLTWFVVAGTIIGARLGHVFFYEWPRYRENLWDIPKVWEGGLASHGGTLGVMLAIAIFLRIMRKRYPELTYIYLLDALCIPAAMVGMWIRIGNFFNQEITGPVTTLPWAIVFGHPAEGGGALPRHPTQLYEAFAYLITFIIVYTIWRRSYEALKPGRLIGIFMILCFGSRFFIEFVKNPNSLMLDESILLTGQLLSIPFIVLGVVLLYYSYSDKKIKNILSLEK